MKREWIIGGLVAALAALAAVWIVRNTEWTDVTLPTPLKGEAARNPLYAAGKLAETLGATAVRPQSFARMPPDGAILVLASDYWDLFPERRDELRAWVERGGRLLAGANRIDVDDELSQWLGVRTTFHRDAARQDAEARKAGKADGASAPEDDDTEDDEETESADLPPSPGPRIRRCERLTEPEAAAAALAWRTTYRVCGFSAYFTIEPPGETAWRLDNRLGAQALRVTAGKGAVTLLQSDNILRYGNLLLGDNAALFVAASGLRTGDTVWLVALEEADSIFALTWRHGAPVVVLLAVAIVLALWRGLRRFGPAAPPPQKGRRSLAEQIRGTGEFLLRQRRGPALRAALVRELEAAGARRVSGWSQLPSEARTAAIARGTGLDAKALARAMTTSADAPRRELESAIALMETARRRLLRPTWPDGTARDPR